MIGRMAKSLFPVNVQGQRLAQSFGKLPYIKKWRDIAPVYSRDIFKDDLYYDHEKDEPYKNVVKTIRDDPSKQYNERAVANLLFNMSRVDHSDEIIFDQVEQYVQRFRGTYKSRIAFGALSGGLKLNLKPFILKVFIEDAVEDMDNISISE
jgi:hypothetical protein